MRLRKERKSPNKRVRAFKEHLNRLGAPKVQYATLEQAIEAALQTTEMKLNSSNLVDFWIGDLCYVLGDREDIWNEVCNLIFPADQCGAGGCQGVYGTHTLKDGRKFVVFHTKYGDGCYEDQHGKEYPVDAGIIGAIAMSDIAPSGKSIVLGNVYALDPNLVYNHSDYNNGKISIAGEVVIDTDPA